MVSPLSTPRYRGLTAEEVEASRQRHGENCLTQGKRNGFWRQLLASFGDPIIKVLLAALAMNLIFLFRQSSWYESVGIAVAIFLATFVSTLSEYGSESAFLKLQEDASRIECRVLREGKTVAVPIGEIVVGDLVLLQSGERIPADGELITGTLSVDQSALNGESREAKKQPGPEGREWDLRNANQLFSGSVVSSGEGMMRVCAVGDATLYGDMAREMQEDTRESPLKVRLNGLAAVISKLGYCAAALVALADLFNSLFLANGLEMARVLETLRNLPVLLEHLLHAATLGITVVVVAVPEGLPMMITVVLSSNMLRMLRDHVLVRKLVGIETSGSLNILFTDKTGTITRGRLQVSTVVTGAGKAYEAETFRGRKPLYELLELSCWLNTSSTVSEGRALGGNATDRALLEYAISGEPKGYSVVETLPFDSARKYSMARIRGRRNLVLVKGAPEKLLPACTRYYDEEGQVRAMQAGREMRKRWEELAHNAVRVLAVAVADTMAGERFGSLTLVGLVGIRDEIRPESRGAIQQVREAGVQVVMITGDNRETAVAIAREAGLIDKLEGRGVITSDEMARMGDVKLKSILRDLRVVARPAHGQEQAGTPGTGNGSGGRHDRRRHQRRSGVEAGGRGLCHGWRHRGGQGSRRHRDPGQQLCLHRQGDAVWSHHLQKHPQVYHLPIDDEPMRRRGIDHRALYWHRYAGNGDPNVVDQHYHGCAGGVGLCRGSAAAGIHAGTSQTQRRTGDQPLYVPPDLLHRFVHGLVMHGIPKAGGNPQPFSV